MSDEIVECIKKKKALGMNEDEARLGCTNKTKTKTDKKEPDKKEKEANIKKNMSFIMAQPLTDLNVMGLKEAYKKRTELKLKPFNNILDMESIRDEIDILDNQIWDLERDYRKVSGLGREASNINIQTAKIQGRNEVLGQ